MIKARPAPTYRESNPLVSLRIGIAPRDWTAVPLTFGTALYGRPSGDPRSSGAGAIMPEAKPEMGDAGELLAARILEFPG